MSSKTRLDRLLSLLDAGTSSVTRQAAAQQIGEIQKYHPHDLQKLLLRVHEYLRSEKWETRIAAGQAISAIASQVPPWQPKYDPEKNSEDVIINTGHLRFDTIDFEQVLEFGTELLASGGTEYEDVSDISNPQERLANQKAQLEQRMGIGAQLLGMTDMIDDDDFRPSATPTPTKIVTEESRQKIADVQAVLNNANIMSARERNRLKRKAKEEAKTREQERKLENLRGSMEVKEKKKEFKNVVTEQPQKNDKLVIEAVADTEAMLNSESVWPFHMICAILLNELFDSCWEVRHGAIVGLREILKIHGTGAGRTGDVDIPEQNTQNRMWLQDCCIRFLCIFALDRFGDYVSGDQVVVPVRETCAQAFGAIASFMEREDILLAYDVLLRFQKCDKWEVRHGSLLGLKYLIAVRKDLIDIILPSVIESVIQGLSDTMDDVRSVAADTLLPVAEHVVRICGDKMPRILRILWDILLDLDDLTASTNSVMNLLAEFHSSVETGNFTQIMFQEHVEMQETHPLVILIPRLWPFLQHNISSVRMATLRTLLKLFQLPLSTTDGAWLVQVAPNGFRHVFQSVLLESKSEITQTALELWTVFLHITGMELSAAIAEQLTPLWMHLISTPIHSALNPDFLLKSQYHNAPAVEEEEIVKPGKKRGRPPKSKAEPDAKRSRKIPNTSADQGTKTKTAVFLSNSDMRENGCRALAYLLANISSELLPRSYSLLHEYLTAIGASYRITAGIILEMIGRHRLEEVEQSCLFAFPEALAERLHACLTETVQYVEYQPVLQRIRDEYRTLSSSMISFGAPGDVFQNNMEQLDVKAAHYTASAQFEQFMVQLSSRLDDSIQRQLKARQQLLLTAIDTYRKLEVQLVTSVRAIAACVIVCWGNLPDKLNPIIRALMASIKKETDDPLQVRGAYATALLTRGVAKRTTCPNSKIIKNICGSLASDSKDSSAESDAVESSSVSTAVHGAQLALQSVAQVYGDKLLEELPSLTQLLQSVQDKDVQGKSLRDVLQVYLVILPHVHQGLYPFFLQILTTLFDRVQTPDEPTRTQVAKTIGAYCKVATLECMKRVIDELLPFLQRSESEVSRLGVAETIHEIIQYLDLQVLPYLVFLVVPILTRMSDQSIAVRKLVTRSFATCVRLMPLERGVENPEGFTQEMIERKNTERQFLEQLLDGSKLEQYDLPIPVNAQLRKYQQEGLNWLAFLQKYKLHGILCDDMGLGKTLQTLCIIVSSNYTRKTRFAQTRDPASSVLPSMVVCPPTVTGHWYHEVYKFFSEYATAVQYVGNPAERAALRDKILEHDIVIMSYDILRNDIQYLKEITWNYCALDEGHIIRNAKTRITQAAKMVNANHRLILSGTPIQNNVLELWSLFDFLMPGFLGTERQFNQLYGKPILASRDPKCSQRDQERGTLALEGLHRQVLPFLLRRVKEDVLHDLPPKIIQDYYCELSPLQKRLYEDFAQSPACKNIHDDIQSEPQHEKKKGTHIFQALQYLRKLCNHPLLVLDQQHPEYTAVMGDLQSAGDTMHNLQHAPKLMALKELLTECGIGCSESASSELNLDAAPVGRHRVLIFAQLKKMLDIVETDLLQAQFPTTTYLRLDGSVHSSKRHDIVTKFNDDPTIDLLLLTTHVGGLGLNLTGADTVIFIEHDWNPMKDLQAMDRAHRLGQTRVVNVYRLITRGTLEEKIMGLQRFKMNIANSVVNQENNSLRTMNTDQLLDLFDLDEKGEKSASKEGVDQFGNVPTQGKASANQIVESLGELWDDSQYEEYDLDNFVSSLQNS